MVISNSLAELSRANADRHPLVIEISERFVTDLEQMPDQE